MKRPGLLGLFFLINITGVWAQVNVGEKGTIKGTVFGDYYWVASNHNEALEGNNGFWFRRIYFTYDHNLNESFSTRLRLEMSGVGDFSSSSKMSPAVKDAYLKWANEQHEIYAGISSTPTWGLVEDVWGYRSVEKTALDLQGLGSSRDFGISVTGVLDEEERWSYHAMIGNGHSNNGAEINQGKKLMLSLAYALTEQIIVEVYGDWNNLPGDVEWSTFQGFLGVREDNYTMGIQFAHQHRSTPGPNSYSLDIASVFARTTFTENTAGFIRLDHLFDPNPAGEGIDYIPFSNQAESTLLIAGMDFTLQDNIHLMPNIEAVFYGETVQGATPGSDLIPRMTLAFSF